MFYDPQKDWCHLQPTLACYQNKVCKSVFDTSNWPGFNAVPQGNSLHKGCFVNLPIARTVSFLIMQLRMSPSFPAVPSPHCAPLTLPGVCVIAQSSFFHYSARSNQSKSVGPDLTTTAQPHTASPLNMKSNVLCPSINHAGCSLPRWHERSQGGF